MSRGERKSRREEKETVGEARPQLPTSWVGGGKDLRKGGGEHAEEMDQWLEHWLLLLQDPGSIPYVVAHNCL